MRRRRRCYRYLPVPVRLLLSPLPTAVNALTTLLLLSYVLCMPSTTTRLCAYSCIVLCVATKCCVCRWKQEWTFTEGPRKGEVDKDRARERIEGWWKDMRAEYRVSCEEGKSDIEESFVDVPLPQRKNLLPRHSLRILSPRTFSS